jgi:hypothetical protein
MKHQDELLETPHIIYGHNIEETKHSPEKHRMLSLVEQAFALIKDNLDDLERRGKYLFKVVDCNQHYNDYQSPIRQKPIDLYDLMDVELRMIRQKNLEISSKQEGTAASAAGMDDDEYPHQRSKQFSHIESAMKQNLNQLSASQ